MRSGGKGSGRPSTKTLPSQDVQEFRKALDRALNEKDSQGRVWSNAKWGAYAFYDYDGEPIYVGQTNERLRVRIRRHLTNQRTDVVAMRILDPFKVAELEVWPLWEFEDSSPSVESPNVKVARMNLNALENSVYRKLIKESKFNVVLNEKLPPSNFDFNVSLPPSKKFSLVGEVLRIERGHPDVRIARRAENLARLSAVAHERGEVSEGMRRVIVLQAVRLAYLAAARLAYVKGEPEPDASSIDIQALIGKVFQERDGLGQEDQL